MTEKRDPKSAEAEGATTASAASSKSPMEESADALAGVEGALTGSKRKASAEAGPAGKKSATSKGNEVAGGRARSNSIEQLAEVAGSLLKDASTPAAASLAAAAAAAGATSLAAAAASVPDPMAAASTGTIDASSAPTGFRKKGTAAAKAFSSSAKSKASAAAEVEAMLKDDGKKKTQITYNPDIPMTKEQLTAWRREMRRVRNRESAAASRRKVRDRIEELEDEVAVWKKRYHEVMGKLDRTNNGDSKRKRNWKGGGESEAKSDGKDEDVQV